MNYAELKWSIIQEWNSDAKFTNEYLIDLGKTSNVEIKIHTLIENLLLQLLLMD